MIFTDFTNFPSLSPYYFTYHIFLSVHTFKSSILKNFAKFAGKHLHRSLFLLICEIIKNTCFYRTPPVAASDDNQILSESSYRANKSQSNLTKNTFL